MTERTTFIDVLRDRAESEQATKGYTFLADNGDPEERLDYAELERRARALAAWLCERLAKGDRALLVFDAGVDYVVALFGCLYAGVLAVPVSPPNPLRPGAGLAHLDRVAGQAMAGLALSSADLVARLLPLLSGFPSASALDWVDARQTPEINSAFRPPDVTEDDVAILQYTSGSTSDPKGVIVTHRNLVHNAVFIREAFGLSRSSRAASWLPPHHDMGLMGGILEPLFVGIDMVLLPPHLFVQQPLRLLQAITRFRITGCGGPSFAYDLLTRRVPETAKAQLDLSSWSLAFCGAEPVRASTLDAFVEAFERCGFHPEAFLPCYGLAEATLIVSATAPRKTPRRFKLETAALERGRVVRATDEMSSPVRTIVSCGRPPAGVTVVVVDPETRATQPHDRIGEIWVKGPNVARGYWADPAATGLAFDAGLPSGEGGYLRTGDLGFLDDGELFVTGRLKDLIVIRGRNLAPEDIEVTIEQAHASVRAGRCAAFSAEVDSEERLVVACEIPRRSRPDESEIKEAIRSAVASAHGIAPHAIILLEPGRLPRTSSGKPRRSLCRQWFLDGRLSPTLATT